MKNSEILTTLLKKSIIPITIAALLFLVSKNIFTSNGTTDYFYVWIVCGLPFGFNKFNHWFSYSGPSLGVAVAIFLLNFVVAGLIGGFILIWKLIIAIRYIPKAIYELIINYQTTI